MKRILIAIALLAAAPLFAQPKAAPAKTSSRADLVVATVNGEKITAAQLDERWNRMPDRLREQYAKAGGKAAFLENYVGRRLLIQKAIAAGYGKRPEVQQAADGAAKESALFDAYVRGAIAPQVVPESQVRSFYDQNPTQFTYGERRYLRYILISTSKHSVAEAREILAPIVGDLLGQFAKLQGRPPEEFGRTFSDYARKYSEDPTAPSGGDIGWYEQSHLDPQLAEGVFAMHPGKMSGILETDKGLHLFYVERSRPAGKETYEESRASIHEYLLANNMQKIMAVVSQTTAGLRASGKVQTFPENVR
jgi:parvulin-like peptidyl-prolyl isomerase